VIRLWLVAFLWTLAIEQPIYWLALRRRTRRWWHPGAICALANAITHPLLWFAYPQFEPYVAYVLLGEICVALAEAALIYAVVRDVRVAITTSLAANATSTLLGIPLIAALA
jgi:hypothetical protein